LKAKITRDLERRGYKNIRISENVTIQYNIYNKVLGDPGTKLGRVTWTLELQANVTATDPKTRKVVGTTIRLGYAQGRYEAPDRYGDYPYFGPGAR
jgi:hypothetical protein